VADARVAAQVAEHDLVAAGKIAMYRLLAVE
jgi:hypothetical protein